MMMDAECLFGNDAMAILYLFRNGAMLMLHILVRGWCNGDKRCC